MQNSCVFYSLLSFFVCNSIIKLNLCFQELHQKSKDTFALAFFVITLSLSQTLYALKSEESWLYATTTRLSFLRHFYYKKFSLLKSTNRKIYFISKIWFSIIRFRIVSLQIFFSKAGDQWTFLWNGIGLLCFLERKLMISIENKFSFKPYQYTQCKDFWEHIFHDKNFNGYVYFCTKNDKTFNNFHYCKASDISDFLSSLQIHKNLDYYYTPTHFRVNTNGIKRDGNHIFAYTCCVVDIDCHNKKMPYDLLEKNLHTYLQKLDLQINNNECTPYNIILKSGRDYF